MDHKKERRKPLRPAALAAIAGIDEAHALRRSEWIQRIPDGEDDNSMSHVIQKLVKESVVGAYGRTDQRRYYDLRTASPTTAPPDAPAPPAPTHRKREREEVNAAPGAPAGSGACHFAVHDDLSLSISDGTSVLILPPEDVRRMTRFLNLFAPCQ
jgi:hypothetical protein